MSKESPYSPYSNLIFRETFNGEQSVRKNNGVPTNVTFNNGIGIFNTGSAKIVYKSIKNIKSIRIVLSVFSTTQHICKLSSSHSISVSSGTISGTGISSPTIYVNGAISSTLTTAKSEIVITTSTSFNATDFQVGYISTYLRGDIELIELYNSTLTASEVSNLYNNRTNIELPSYSSNIVGGNLITNGSFNSSTGWTVGTNWSIDNGVAIGSNTYNTLYTSISSLSLNKKYKVVADITVTSGTLYFQLGAYNSIAISSTVSVSGRYEGDLMYLSGSAIFYVVTNGFIGTIDNISLYELSPNLLLDFDSSKGTLKERTGKTLIPTDITYKKIGNNYSAYFNGTTSKIDCSSDFIGTKAVTVMGWIYAKTFGESNVSRIVDNGSILFGIYSINSILFFTAEGAGIDTYASSNSVFLYRWLFVSVTRTASGAVNFYIGNKSIAPTLSGTANQPSGTPAAGTTNIIIGNNNGQTRTFNGYIQQLKIYEGILDLATITQYWSESLKDIK